ANAFQQGATSGEDLSRVTAQRRDGHEAAQLEVLRSRNQICELVDLVLWGTTALWITVGAELHQHRQLLCPVAALQRQTGTPLEGSNEALGVGRLDGGCHRATELALLVWI